MMTDIFPAGVQAAGNNTFVWSKVAPAIAGSPTVAEINAATALDITCYVKTDAFQVGFDQPREDDTRWCDASTRETFGIPNFTLEQIQHVVNPQGTGAETGNLAAGQIEENATATLYVRLGVKAGTAPAIGQVWDTYSVTTGKAAILPLASGKYVRTVQTKLTLIQAGFKVTA